MFLGFYYKLAGFVGDDILIVTSKWLQFIISFLTSAHNTKGSAIASENLGKH